MNTIFNSILSLVIMFGMNSVASRPQRKPVEVVALFQKDKTKIKKEELPEASRKALEGDAFKGWALLNAYKLANGEYEVELKKGDTVQAIKFDKEGKLK